MKNKFKFNRMELSGSLGDLGTLLPLGIGMILINGLNPMGVFFAVGLFYIFSGLYFGVTCPVEPMKVIAAYAIATGVTAVQIQASGLLISVLLLFIGLTGLMTFIGSIIPKPVVRGVQLSTGVLLISKGAGLMMGSSAFQRLHPSAETDFVFQNLGPVPLGLIIGIGLAVLTLFLIDNRRLPAAIIVVGSGFVLGLIMGGAKGLQDLQPGFYVPGILPYGFPKEVDFAFALVVMTLPQIPMTLGNAVMANADLSLQYFPQSGRKVSYRALCISMGLANMGSFFVGGMPMCHGAGGLASRYRFGARTAGSNLIIGVFFLAIAVFLGGSALSLVSLIPSPVLGVLLVFAGGQLALTLLDITTRKDLFTAILVLGITIASNLSAGFIAGICVAHLFRWKKLKI
ncbi:MAG: sulfate permease [Desulfobacteraceae bacterium]|nr:sulfate permease [Desulfobacteraceae bacterium]